MRHEAPMKMSGPTHNSIYSSTRSLTHNPTRSPTHNSTGNSTSISGWIFDLYPSPHGMTLWLIGPNQTRHRLIDRFAPVFYVSGPDAVLRRLRGEAARQPHALACRAAGYEYVRGLDLAGHAERLAEAQAQLALCQAGTAR